MNFRLLVISSACPSFKAPETAHTMLLCEHLARENVEVHLLTTSGNAFDGEPPPGLTMHPIMENWRWGQLPRLLRFIRSNHFDAVLLIYIDWIYKCHPMVTVLPTLTKRFCGTSNFTTQFENESGLSGMIPPHGIKSRLIKRLVSRLIGRRGLHPIYGSLLRDSSHLIALSERHLEGFERAHPGVAAKAEVIPAPPLLRRVSDATCDADRRRGRAMLGVSEQDIVLAYFGYLYPMKGIETLLAAFGRLPPSTRLVIIGSGEAAYLEKLHELSRNAGGAERVTWLGHQLDEAASLYLCGSDVCVLPFNDGVRLNNSSFAVAISHGLPVVSTRGETLESPFRDGENVRLCAPRNPATLAAAIEELIDCPETRRRLAAGGRKLAEDHFSWERVIESTLKVLGGSGAFAPSARRDRSNPAKASCLDGEVVGRK